MELIFIFLVYRDSSIGSRPLGELTSIIFNTTKNCSSTAKHEDAARGGSGYSARGRASGKKTKRESTKKPEVPKTSGSPGSSSVKKTMGERFTKLADIGGTCGTLLWTYWKWGLLPACMVLACDMVRSAWLFAV